MLRRKLLSLLSGLPFLPSFLKAQVNQPLPTGAEILRSFDARDWATAFIAHVERIPGIATDHDTMTGWFANSLMRGYDQARQKHIVAISEDELRERLRGAVARGWCADKNANKEMDADLAEAIVEELLALNA